MTDWVMFDGALMRDEIDVQHLVQSGGAVAVYADFGEEAAAAGPVLMPADLAPSVRSEPRASLASLRARRYGRAALTTDVTVEELAAHLRSIRSLHTADGQRFFFRMADSRSLEMLWTVLDEQQRGALLGPVAAWSFTDASGVSITFSRQQDRVSPAPLPMRLTDAALHRLTELSWPWQLLVAAEDAGAEIPSDASDRYLLDLVSEATRMVREAGAQAGFAVETSLAVALITTRGTASQNPRFAVALSEARTANRPDAIYRWLDEAQGAQLVLGVAQTA